ncbi:MAG: pyrroline-5-carboxylate reductase [Acidimicrobiales bacterium]|nr:MAG: pyrroline-5-carboxylate reductase [Acidimicrobiales bacterium]
MVKEKLSTTTHALIGAGHMGGALLNGWLSAKGAARLDPSQILVIDPSPGEAATNAFKLGTKFAKSLTRGSASGIQLCLLAIKPQLFAKVGPDLAKALPRDALIVSIMAGISIDELIDVFSTRPIIRCMPNTPGAIGQGITAFMTGPDVTAKHVKMAELRLKAAGEVVRVDNERQIDMVTALSGSGPAYVFYLAEAMKAAGIKLGLPEDLAKALARQTVIGSGAMLAASSESAASLREAVTSPGGTTEAALEILMADDGLVKLMRNAITKAYDRSRELGGKK